MEQARKAAALNGLRIYQGKPCKYGHDGRRRTSSGGCVQCANARSKSDRDRIRELLVSAK